MTKHTLSGWELAEAVSDAAVTVCCEWLRANRADLRKQVSQASYSAKSSWSGRVSQVNLQVRDDSGVLHGITFEVHLSTSELKILSEVTIE